MVQVQQKVLGIIPSTTGPSQQTFTSFQPRTATVTIRPNTSASAGTTTTSQVITGPQIRPGMTVIRTPLQQPALGKAIIRTPVVVQPGTRSRMRETASAWTAQLGNCDTSLCVREYPSELVRMHGEVGSRYILCVVFPKNRQP